MEEYNFLLQEKIHEDTLQAKYEEEAKVPFVDYLNLEERVEKLEMAIEEINNCVAEKDWIGLEEFIKNMNDEGV